MTATFPRRESDPVAVPEVKDLEGRVAVLEEGGGGVTPEELEAEEAARAKGDGDEKARAAAAEKVLGEADAAEAKARADGDTKLAELIATVKALAEAALPLAGGTMLGPLIAAADPTQKLEVATRKFVLDQYAALVNGAPEALDTLKELGEALKAAEASGEGADKALTKLVEGKLAKEANLADLLDKKAARDNLELGSAATKASGDFDAAGAATIAEGNAKASAAGEVKSEKEARESAVKSEKEAREKADATEETARKTGDATEKARAEGAEAGLQSEIGTLENLITGAPLVFKGVINCSGNPNYPAANPGHTYIVSVAGKIGGILGELVEPGDALICTKAAAEGIQAVVGSSWIILDSATAAAALVKGERERAEKAEAEKAAKSELGTAAAKASGDFELASDAGVGKATPEPSFIAGMGEQPRGVATDGTYLYWGSRATDTIGRAKLDGSGANFNFIAVGGSGIRFVKVIGTKLYWTYESKIGRANLDGSSAEPNFFTAPGPGGPWDVFADGTYIYWTDDNSEAFSIGRAKLSGAEVNDKFITGGSDPSGLTGDGTYLYWTNQANGTIGRAKVDGSEVKQEFIKGVGELLNGIAVDSTYIYWAKFNKGIGRARLDGSEVNTGFVSAKEPDGVTASGSFLYWTSRTPGSVGRFRLGGWAESDKAEKEAREAADKTEKEGREGAVKSEEERAKKAEGEKLAQAENLKDLKSAATARTNLGLAIGTDIQAWDKDLDELAKSATQKFGREVLEQNNAEAVRNLIGVSAAANLVTATLAKTVGPIKEQTALQNITGLNFAIGESITEMWRINALLYFEAENATMDTKIGWSAPGSPTGRWGVHAALATFGANAIGAATTATAEPPFMNGGSEVWNGQFSAFASRTSGGTAVVGVKLEGTIISAGTAGTVQLRYAQNTSNAGNLSVLAGSVLEARKVAS